MAPVNVNDSTVFRDGAGVCGGGGEFLILNGVWSLIRVKAMDENERAFFNVASSISIIN